MIQAPVTTATHARCRPDMTARMSPMAASIAASWRRHTVRHRLPGTHMPKVTSRIDEIRARVAQTAWQNRVQADRDAEYLLVLIAEAEDRFNRIRERECELSNHPGVYECRIESPCLGCSLRNAEEARDANAQGWRETSDMLQSQQAPCRRCAMAVCPPGCCCPCHKDSPPLNPDATYRPEPHEYRVVQNGSRARDPSYPPPPPPPRPYRP